MGGTIIEVETVWVEAMIEICRSFTRAEGVGLLQDFDMTTLPVPVAPSGHCMVSLCVVHHTGLSVASVMRRSMHGRPATPARLQ